MRQRARQAFVVTAWLFVGSIVIQVFLAGMGLFAGGVESLGYWGTHVDWGFTGVHGTALLTLILAFVARLPREAKYRTALPTVFSFILPTFTWARDEFPIAAALHPVGAVLLFWWALDLARRARSYAPGRLPADKPETVEIESAQS